jgi:hypothetical protein
MLQILAASCERWPCMLSPCNTLSSTRSIKLDTCRITDAAGISLRPWPRVLQLSDLVGMICQRLAATVSLRRVEGYVRRSHLLPLFLKIHVFGSFSRCKIFDGGTHGVRLLSVITLLIRGCWILMLFFVLWCVCVCVWCVCVCGVCVVCVCLCVCMCMCVCVCVCLLCVCVCMYLQYLNTVYR